MKQTIKKDFMMVKVSLKNVGTHEHDELKMLVAYDHTGEWCSEIFTQAEFSCDCTRSRALYREHPLYHLPCNYDDLNTIIITNISIDGIEDSTIYKEEHMDDGKTKKIIQEIENLTPYLTELQEFKEKGLFLPEGATKEVKDPVILDAQGKRTNKRKTKAEVKHDLDVMALKLRVLQINKWLDERFMVLLPKFALKLVRRYPQARHIVLKLFLTKVEIVHKKRPVPYGSDLITITSFWKVYDEVQFVWEK